MATPFVLSTHGKWEIPRPAERCIVNVSVTSEGHFKATVSEEVVTAAHQVERHLRELAPPDDTPEATEASPLAHWAKTGLSARSYIPYSNSDHQSPRKYTATITFDIRFKKFRELGAFATKLSALPHTEISNISWILTPATHKAHESLLRKEATKNALEKARDYCDVLGCTNLRPVELTEGNVSSSGLSGGLFGSSRWGAQQQAQQQARGTGLFGGQGAANDSRDESPLEFTPKEVRMSMDVTIKFHAE